MRLRVSSVRILFNFRFCLPTRLVTAGELDQNPPVNSIHCNPLTQEKDTSKKNKNKIDFHIGTYNVRTMASTAKLIDLTNALNNVKYDILGLSEMRKVGHCIDEYDDFMLCYSGQTKGRYGVGFIIKKYLKPCVKNFIGLSDRVALLDIDINDTPITIIQVYAPTEESDEVEIESFYETLHRAHANSSKYTIVMGDFNAKVGQKDTEENKLLGRFGFGKRSSRGQLLIQYAQEYNLSIMNTFFKKKPSRKWTWKSPDQTTMNEIDYILTNFPNKFKDVHVLNNIKFPSDHRMVRSKISLKQIKKSRVKYKCSTYSLKNQNETNFYLEKLENNTKSIKPDDTYTGQSLYNKLEECILDSMKTEKQKEKRNFTCLAFIY
ncbi:unnamed protein product [Euphydryas editha]|uniref:Endonuclease/exonuclease/phosphatase domain-containing protein n=1 Tax=Euphydryas editha TaxID=104508 RepID=A0AAU9TBJ3_EUPED|nr:unnamed protein product [Euphydryas editha]